MHVLTEWAADQGLTHVLNGDTPLGALARRAQASNIVEFAGRHCYRSWEKGRGTADYLKNIIESDHGSVLEHVNYGFAISGISRNLSLEHNRHRVGIAISQESQRYVEAQDMNFVEPPLYTWLSQMGDCLFSSMYSHSCEAELAAYESAMKHLKSLQVPHKRMCEAARATLPGGAETRMTWTANVRALRHYFQKRGSIHADLEIRRLAIELFRNVSLGDSWMFFYDFALIEGEYGVPVLTNDPSEINGSQ